MVRIRMYKCTINTDYSHNSGFYYYISGLNTNHTA